MPPLPAAKSLLLLQPWPGRGTGSSVPWAGDSWQHTVPFQKVLSDSFPQAHPDLPELAGQLPCSLPTSVCPAHCPASIWDTSVTPEPLRPVELGKTELLPIQHSSRWQRDVSKVMQGHRGNLSESGDRLYLNLMC